MKHILLFTIFNLSVFFSPNSKCKSLSDGKYKVHFTDSVYKDYEIIIHDSNYIQYQGNKDPTYGKVIWIYDCNFYLKYCGPKIADSLNSSAKFIHETFGNDCIELKEVIGDTIKFRTTFDRYPHLTINRGYFLRVEG